MATKQDLINHLEQTVQAMKSAGQDTSQAENTISMAKAKGAEYLNQPLNMNPQSQQALQMTQQAVTPQAQTQPMSSNSPQLNLQMPQQAPAQKPQQNQVPAYGDIDVRKLIQQALGAGQALNPNIVQGAGNVISTAFGGKPYVSPAQEIAQKAAEANLSITPYKAMLMSSQINKNQAGAAKDVATTGVETERARGMKSGNNLLEASLNGQGGQQTPNMVVSGVSTGARGGVTMKNMNEVAQEGGIKANIKGMESQDAKVSSSAHALAMLDQRYDANSDTFNITPPEYQELASNIAATVSNSPNTSEHDRAVIAQKTLQGDWNGILSFISGAPQNASSQEIFHRLFHSLARQGLTSQVIRQDYANKLGIAPSGTDFQQRLQNSPVNQALGNQQGQAGGTPEGTVISNGQQKLIKKGGQWVPTQ